MPKVVRLIFLAAAMLMLLSTATCGYADHIAWRQTSFATEESTEYAIACGGYTGMTELKVLGVVLGFFVAPIFFAGWLFWYREVQLESAQLTILPRKENLATGRVDVKRRNEDTGADFPKQSDCFLQPYDAEGLTPLERALAKKGGVALSLPQSPPLRPCYFLPHGESE